MPHKKKIALAMSGAGPRAVVYFGILDVFNEHGIKIDYLSACSSATFIACAYASGTLDRMKQRVMSMDQKEVNAFYELSFKGGLFSLDGMWNEVKKYVSEENLEDLKTPIAIVASDIVHGEEVAFTMGSVERAVKASCSMPGLFEPVVWGDRVLLDGGLFNIIPVDAAAAFNPDIVIGVDMATTRNLFDDSILRFKRGYNIISKPLRYLYKTGNGIKNYFWPKKDIAISIDDIRTPNILAVLDKAMDYAIYERRKGEYINCDLVITPDVSAFKKNQLEKLQEMYQEGRRAAEMAVPEIKKLLK